MAHSPQVSWHHDIHMTFLVAWTYPGRTCTCRHQSDPVCCIRSITLTDRSTVGVVKCHDIELEDRKIEIKHIRSWFSLLCSSFKTVDSSASNSSPSMVQHSLHASEALPANFPALVSQKLSSPSLLDLRIALCPRYTSLWRPYKLDVISLWHLV